MAQSLRVHNPYPAPSHYIKELYPIDSGSTRHPSWSNDSHESQLTWEQIRSSVANMILLHHRNARNLQFTDHEIIVVPSEGRRRISTKLPFTNAQLDAIHWHRTFQSGARRVVFRGPTSFLYNAIAIVKMFLDSDMRMLIQQCSVV